MAISRWPLAIALWRFGLWLYMLYMLLYLLYLLYLLTLLTYFTYLLYLLTYFTYPFENGFFVQVRLLKKLEAHTSNEQTRGRASRQSPVAGRRSAVGSRQSASSESRNPVMLTLLYLLYLLTLLTR